MKQYQTMNLAGAENLQQKYTELVQQQKQKITQKTNNEDLASTTVQENVTTISNDITAQIAHNERQRRLLTKLCAKKTKNKLTQKEETISETTAPLSPLLIQITPFIKPERERV